MPRNNETERRSSRRSFLIAALGAGSVLALGACSNETVVATPAPTSEAPSQTVSPGASESPSLSYELDLNQSDIYKSLSAEDKEAVDAALKLPVTEGSKGAAAAVEGEDFYHVHSDTRALVAYIITEASPKASEAHYREVNKDYPELVDDGVVSEYLQTRTETFYDADPKTVASEPGIVETSVNTVVETAFGLALNASKLPDDDPAKQEMLDNAYRVLAGVFYGVENDREAKDSAMLAIHKDLVERLDAVAEGDVSQIYNTLSYEDNKLPKTADQAKVVKSEIPSGEGNATETAWYYNINPTNKTYISGTYPDGNVTYVATKSTENGVYTWRLHSASEKGDVTYADAS